MFTDTITTGTVSVTYTRRSNKGTRSVFVPSGDTPVNERKQEIAHEVTAAKRTNSLVKFAITYQNPITGVLEEVSFNGTWKRPASATEAQVQLVTDHFVKFATAANVTKIFNIEQ